jgi:nitronate monooxygenase
MQSAPQAGKAMFETAHPAGKYATTRSLDSARPPFEEGLRLCYAAQPSREKAMKSNRICELLGVGYPIFQAPMGRSAPPELAAAVSNAGAVGMLGTSWDDPATLRAKIRATRALTRHPFAVNFALDWDQHERLAVALEEKVRLVSFFWGDAGDYIEPAKNGGAVVCVTVGDPEQAKKAADQGADILVAQGVEAGGHVWSTLSTMVLVPLVCDAAPTLPVVAAGGIADARGVRAALALGAQGVWVGTRFLCTPEAGAHEEYKRRLIAAGSRETLLTTLFDGGWPNAPHRVLRNATVTAWEQAGCPKPGQRPGEGIVIGTFPDGKPVRRYDVPAPMRGATGEIDAFALYAGQSVGLVTEMLPAAEVVGRLAAGLH